VGTTANLPLHQVRADYDRGTIVVYQAYRADIAEAAVRAQRFVEPFSLNRMTWIKPSFLWLMGRSNWAPQTRAGAHPGGADHARGLGERAVAGRADRL